MKAPTGRRGAPPDDRLRAAIRGPVSPHSAEPVLGLAEGKTRGLHAGYALLRRDAELLDETAPLVGVACRHGAELLGRRLRDLDGELVHARLHLGEEENAADLGIEPRDNIARHAGGAIGAVPHRHLVAGQGLGDGRHVGQKRGALALGDGEQAQLARLHVRQALRSRGEEELRAACDRVGDGGRAAAIGNVHHLDARHLLEQRAAQVIGRAGAGGGVVDLAGILFRVIDEFLHGLRRNGGVHHHGVGDVGEQRDRREILDAVERHLGEERVVHRVHAHRVEQERVAVGRGARDGCGADVAGGAGAVLDQDRLAERLIEMSADDARQDVGRAAGRERDDEGERAIRPGCGPGAGKRRRGRKAREGGEQGSARRLHRHRRLRNWRAESSANMAKWSMRPFRPSEIMPAFTTRPEIRGTFGAAATTHWIASAVAMAALERGGNAFDAAVAAGFVLQIIEPHLVGPGGEVPIIVKAHDAPAPVVICGQGPYPAAASPARFAQLGLKQVPGTGLLPAVVPGAFDAWMLLLRDYGTLTLADVLAPAIGYAENGFPVLPRVASSILAAKDFFTSEWPTSAAVWLLHGEVPRPRALMRTPQTAATYRRILQEASAAGADRVAQIERARDVFYRGFVAEAID